MIKANMMRLLLAALCVLSVFGCRNDLWEIANKEKEAAVESIPENCPEEVPENTPGINPGGNPEDLTLCSLSSVSFRQADNPGSITQSVTMTLNGDRAEALVPAVVNRSALRPYFEFEGDYLSIDGQRLVNGETAVDFTGARTLRVHAKDAVTTRDYTLELRPATGDLVVTLRSVSGADGKIFLSWDEPETYDDYSIAIFDNANGSRIMLKPRAAAGVGSYTIEKLTNGNHYSYNLRIVSAFGDCPDVTVCAVPDAAGRSYTLIYNADDLNDVRHNAAGHYIVMKPIDLAAQGYAEWVPIPLITGSFDGNGYAISNMHVSGSYSNAGLFASVLGAQLINIHLTKALVESNHSGAALGLLCAQTQYAGKGFISGCSVQGRIDAKDAALVGGLSGKNEGVFLIELSRAELVYDGEASSPSPALSYIGGFAGINFGKIKDCESCVSIVSSASGEVIGGFVAVNQEGAHIKNSKVYSVSGSLPLIKADYSASIGGFVAANLVKSYPASTDAIIESCTVDGGGADIRGKDNIGGFVANNEGLITIECQVKNLVLHGKNNIGGFASLNAGEISDSCCVETVNITGVDFIGGFAARNNNKIFSDCLVATLEIKGTENIGGFIAHNTKIIEGDCQVHNAFIKGADNVGGFCGLNEGDTAHIDSCSAKLITLKGNYCVGGFAGICRHSSVIENSYASSSVEADTDVGGFAGLLINSATVKNCMAKSPGGKIKGREDVGGFVGMSNASEIDYSLSVCNVEGDTDVGGFVGYLSASDGLTSYIKECAAIGSVKCSSTNCGGFAGHIIENYMINDCFSRTQVDGYSCVGGFAGYVKIKRDLSRIYSASTVSGSSAFGSFIGKGSGGSWVLGSSFVDDSLSSLSLAGDSMSLTMNQCDAEFMKKKGIYSAKGWSIDDGFSHSHDWGIDAAVNEGYPLQRSIYEKWGSQL